MDESKSGSGVPIPTRGDPRFRWFCPKPTVRILFYTDASSVNLSSNIEENDFGVWILRELLVHDDGDLATFEITLVNRHDGGHAARKLTSAVLANYDEVWCFGIQQANRPGQSENELTDPEVAALEEWMKTGGVLMTGDHSNPRPDDADASLDPLLGLGRAIGHRVPRAGALRRWDGGPPQYGGAEMANYNTQVPAPDMQPPEDMPNLDPIEGLDPQEDEWPQNLLLTTYAAPSGPLQLAPPYGRVVHRLFCGRTRPIRVFPDHMHEGELVLPSSFDPSTWPSGPSGQPLPEVIARGTDKRNGRVYDLVMAYDGSSAGVGRIVTDSTWHHYFNVNLKGFPLGGYVRVELSQFYVNLAVWLAPPAKRWQIACWQRWKLAHDPNVLMTYRNSRMALGAVAAGVLRRAAGPCVIRDVFEPIRRAGETQSGVHPPAALLLGGVVEAYLDAFEGADAGDESVDELDTDALVARGMRAAYDDFVAELENAAALGARARTLFGERLESIPPRTG
jgi:hypothetical protein